MSYYQIHQYIVYSIASYKNNLWSIIIIPCILTSVNQDWGKLLWNYLNTNTNTNTNTLDYNFSNTNTRKINTNTNVIDPALLWINKCCLLSYYVHKCLQIISVVSKSLWDSLFCNVLYILVNIDIYVVSGGYY